MPVAETGAAVGTACAAAPRGGLRANFAWTFSANVFYTGCQWAVLALLAKSCPAAEVGIFALGLAITAPLMVFSNLQLRNVQATDAHRAYRFEEYLRLRIWTTLPALAATVGLALAQSHNRPEALAICALGAWRALDSMSDVLYGHLQQQERMAPIARSLMCRGLLSVVALAVAVVAGRAGALAASAALAGSSAVTLLFYDWAVTRSARAGEPRITPRAARLLSLALLALPLGLVQGLVSLGANIPRYYLESASGAAGLGIFSALASLIICGQTVINALGNVASPRLASLEATGDRRGFARLLGRLVLMGALLGLGGIALATAFGERILTLLFSPEYGAHNRVLIVLMVGAAFAYVAWLAGFGLTAARLFRVQIPLLAAVCLTAWGASWVLIPRYGLEGAAAAFTVSTMVQAAGAGAILRWRSA